MRSTWRLSMLWLASMRALLGVSAVLLSGAILTRCAPVATLLPANVVLLTPLLVGAALGLLGVVERQTERGTTGALWMQLPRPLSLGLALGLSYFTTVFAQEFGVSLGPVDPTFPTAVPQATATLWFLVFTFGFVGIGMMSAPALLVPLLRVVTAPGSKASVPAQTLIAAGLGALFAGGLLVGLRTPAVEALVKQAQAFFAANATAGTLALIAIGVVPNLLPSKKAADA